MGAGASGASAQDAYTTETSPPLKKPTTFDDFNFSPELKKAIVELGFDSPTPIQQETLPILLKQSTDFLGLAATGTGKTAAFAIPLLENISPAKKGVQALILCPTRELAKQSSEQINLLAKYKKTKALAIYGGSDYGGQLRALKEGVAIVVGTPGRIIDHLERGTLNLNNLQVVVLDEADEMISMGFKEEIEFILKKVQQEVKHQTWLFSATMSREVRRIADQFLHNPQQIQINKTEVTSSAVKQYYYKVHENDKMHVLQKLIDQVPTFYGLIFCQTKLLVTDLTQHLKQNGYAVDCLHGDMEQNARERTMKAFKAKQVNIMVCTDVASRGIDVKDLTHVINYSLPRELDLYVHRIGRTGRGGKEGLALSLVTPSHMGLVSRIEKATQSRMTNLPVPKDSELIQIKLTKALNDFMAENAKDALPVEAMAKLVKESADWAKTLESMSKEELIARFLVKTLKVKADKVAPIPQVVGSGGFRSEGATRERRGFSDERGSGGRFDRGGSGGRFDRSGGRNGSDRNSSDRNNSDRSSRAPFPGAVRRDREPRSYSAHPPVSTKTAGGGVFKSRF